MNTAKDNNRLDWVDAKNFLKSLIVMTPIVLWLGWIMYMLPKTPSNELLLEEDVILKIDRKADYAKTRDLVELVLDAKDNNLDTIKCQVHISTTPEKIITATADVQETVLYIERLSQRKDLKWFMVSRVADTDLDGKPNKLKWLILAQDPDSWFAFSTSIQWEDGGFIDLEEWTPEYEAAYWFQVDITDAILKQAKWKTLSELCVK